MSEWKPIESAPKDGTWVLLGYEGSDTIMIASWNGRSWDDGDFHSTIDGATHWMPRPNPPGEG
jgi:hypothetical protein